MTECDPLKRVRIYAASRYGISSRVLENDEFLLHNGIGRRRQRLADGADVCEKFIFY